MAIGVTLAGVLFRVGTTLFTERVLANLVIVFLKWFADRTSNDLDDEVVRAVKDGLNHNNGEKVGRLYEEIEAGRPKT